MLTPCTMERFFRAYPERGLEVMIARLDEKTIRLVVNNVSLTKRGELS